MNDDDIPPDEVLPCGCVIRCTIENGVKTMFYIPCRETCVNYRNALGLADEMDRPVTKRRAP